MNEVIVCSACKMLVEKILNTSVGSESQLTAQCLKRVSLLLSLEKETSAVTCKQSSNCSSSVLHLITLITQDACQHVLLQHHHEENSKVFQQLHEGDSVGSSSGENFSSIHGDLIAEIYNDKNKRHCRSIDIRI